MLAKPVATNLFEGFFGGCQARTAVRQTVGANLLAKRAFATVRVDVDVTTTPKEGERLAKFCGFDFEFHC